MTNRRGRDGRCRDTRGLEITDFIRKLHRFLTGDADGKEVQSKIPPNGGTWEETRCVSDICIKWLQRDQYIANWLHLLKVHGYKCDEQSQ